MTDYAKTVAMLEKAGQPYFGYTQVGEGGAFRVMALDDERDGGRHVAILLFNLGTLDFVRASTRWLDP